MLTGTGLQELDPEEAKAKALIRTAADQVVATAAAI